jgi:hypothetical protein
VAALYVCKFLLNSPEKRSARASSPAE